MGISNELISLREASKISGYHPDYLSFLIRSKKISGHRVGRMWVVYENDLIKFLKQKESSKNISSNFFYKITKAIFTTFLLAVIVFASFQIIKNPEAGIKVADNISHQNDF